MHARDGRPRFGLCLPLHGGFGPEGRAALLKNLAVMAEDAGFDTLWVEDHRALPAGEIAASEGEPRVDEPLEAYTTLAFLAGITQRVRLGTMVTPLTMRNPAQLADLVKTVDHLSAGRLIMGAGFGWHSYEFRSIGVPFEKKDERYAKVIEALEVLLNLLSGEKSFTFHGNHYHLADACTAPRPLQRPHPPLYFGGFSERIQRAILEHGRGWINGTNVSPEHMESCLRQFRTLAAEAGRNVAEFEIVVPFVCHVASRREEAEKTIQGYIDRLQVDPWLARFFGEATRRYGLWGTPDDVIKRIEPYRKLGVQHFILDPRPPSVAHQTVELVAEKVLPRLG